MRPSTRIAVRWTTLLLALVALVSGIWFLAGPRHANVQAQATELTPIQLPKPVITGGMPLMQALNARRTTRAFADKPLPPQMLSNLLWAAFGINRPKEIKPGFGRTAPSAMNRQEITIEVVLPEGVYTYDAEQNLLRPVRAGDLRGSIGASPAGHAAVTLVYVAPAKIDFAQVDTGFIGQNVYLFAASEGLNAWFYALRGSDVSAKLGLSSDKVALYGQSVGYPPQ